MTSYTCSQSQFDEGYIVVQGVEASKDGETRLLSNRSMDIVGLGENQTTSFKVYPNPTKGFFTVEGASYITVYNTLGQVVATCRDGVHTVSTSSGIVAYQIPLPSGIYFVKSGEGAVKKVVVE